MDSGGLAASGDGPATSLGGYVPIIDLTPAYGGRPADRIAVAATMAQACRSSGFFVVQGHRVPPAVTERMLDAVAEFFRLPQEVKLRLLADETDPLMRGFSWPGRPRDNRDRAAVPLSVHELLESFVYNRLGDARRAPELADGPGHLPERLTLPNKMPDLPGYQAACDAYYDEMERVAAEIMRLFALALDLPDRWFDDKFDQHMSSLAANYYPPQLTPPGEKQIRKGAHSDFGTLTVLCQDETTGGLQVWNEDRRWIDVPVVPGALVVNIGDLMARWTNDTWSSTVHQVVNPPPEKARRPRYSLAFFHQPNPGAEVSCLPSCTGEEGARYRPVAAFDYISTKARRAYMHSHMVSRARTS